MKKAKAISFLIISIVQIGFGQIENHAFEKIITTIEFVGNRSDTTVNVIKYDQEGNQIEKASKLISVSDPTKIDILTISENEKIIEYTWGDHTKTFRKEINSSEEIKRKLSKKEKC